MDDLNLLFSTVQSVKDYRFFANSHNYSCRSHSILRLDIKTKCLLKNSAATSKMAIFNFVDLACNDSAVSQFEDVDSLS